MINRQSLQAILDHVELKGLSEQTIGELRQQFSGCHFTYCMDDDVLFSKAYRETENYNVYLVDSRAHCSTLTDDAELASGIVFAEVIAEEEAA
ncbi:MAG: DUF6129 family protein [Pseudomonadota bacterium]|nr:hypothetical protein [Pseudomonadales bacterium]MDY6921299.1 DUF6129 family protein [Pseudomonadota bacterium]|tara:strand:- start:82 stop:360 length:279 start_codon:yes stop_codon:yes gene_type:complete